MRIQRLVINCSQLALCLRRGDVELGIVFPGCAGKKGLPFQGSLGIIICSPGDTCYSLRRGSQKLCHKANCWILLKPGFPFLQTLGPQGLLASPHITVPPINNFFSFSQSIETKKTWENRSFLSIHWVTMGVYCTGSPTLFPAVFCVAKEEPSCTRTVCHDCNKLSELAVGQSQ